METQQSWNNPVSAVGTSLCSRVNILEARESHPVLKGFVRARSAAREGRFGRKVDGLPERWVCASEVTSVTPDQSGGSQMIGPCWGMIEITPPAVRRSPRMGLRAQRLTPSGTGRPAQIQNAESDDESKTGSENQPLVGEKW